VFRLAIAVNTYIENQTGFAIPSWLRKDTKSHPFRVRPTVDIVDECPLIQ
jgi:hypothetical protein